MRILNPDINLDAFFEKIHKGSLLMLDYDGTLAPFRTERMKAYLYPGVKDRLITLSKSTKTKTFIVSGRRLADLEILLDISNGLELWGSHGLERKMLSGKKFHTHMGPQFREQLNRGIQMCQGIDPKHLEHKPYAIALHWRGMDPEEQIKMKEFIEPLWKQICNNELEIHPFDGGLELRPKGRNKGNVIKQVLSEVANKTDVAYLGDDLTDEEAFIALKQGLKILVREEFRPTLADIFLTSPHELLAFLDRWILAENQTGSNG